MCGPSEAVLMTVTAAPTSRLFADCDSFVIRVAVDRSRLMATATAFEMVVTLLAVVLATETWVSVGTLIRYLAQSFFRVVIIRASSVATMLKAVNAGYFLKMF